MGVGDGVGADVALGRGVGVAVGDGVTLGLGVGVALGFGVAVGTELGVGVTAGVDVGVGEGVADGGLFPLPLSGAAVRFVVAALVTPAAGSTSAVGAADVQETDEDAAVDEVA